MNFSNNYVTKLLISDKVFIYIMNLRKICRQMNKLEKKLFCYNNI